MPWFYSIRRDLRRLAGAYSAKNAPRARARHSACQFVGKHRHHWQGRLLPTSPRLPIGACSYPLSLRLYADAGFGGLTTDLAWDGHPMNFKNGELLTEGQRFDAGSRLVFADNDLDHLAQESWRLTSSFRGAAAECQPVHRFSIPLEPPAAGEVPLRRPISRFSYPSGEARTLNERCQEIHRIQVQGLAKCLDATGIAKAVIGVSGGFGSAYVLLVTAGAFDFLPLPRANILAYSLLGFVTGEQALENAKPLMQNISSTMGEIDIRSSATKILQDIGHPFSCGEPVHNTDFQNMRADERNLHLFRLSGQYGALPVISRNLFGRDLRYTTYGIDDQVAHYGVKASIPKTLMRPLIEWIIERRMVPIPVTDALDRTLSSPASPELLLESCHGMQRAEDEIGPYELQDFNLYYLSQYGYCPSKIAFLAEHARFRPAATEALSVEAPTYDLASNKHWLQVSFRASERPTNSNAQRCQMTRKSAVVARSRRAAIGVHRATSGLRCGLSS